MDATWHRVLRRRVSIHRALEEQKASEPCSRQWETVGGQPRGRGIESTPRTEGALEGGEVLGCEDGNRQTTEDGACVRHRRPRRHGADHRGDRARGRDLAALVELHHALLQRVAPARAAREGDERNVPRHEAHVANEARPRAREVGVRLVVAR
jgi:hypothetical protein